MRRGSGAAIVYENEMAGDEKVFELISALSLRAEARDRTLRMWIFGSRLKRMQRVESDLDICIEIDPLKFESWRSALGALRP